MKCIRQVLLLNDHRYKFLNKLTKTVLKQTSAGEEIKNVLNKATNSYHAKHAFFVSTSFFCKISVVKTNLLFTEFSGLQISLCIDYSNTATKKLRYGNVILKY